MGPQNTQLSSVTGGTGGYLLPRLLRATACLEITVSAGKIEAFATFSPHTIDFVILHPCGCQLRRFTLSYDGPISSAWHSALRFGLAFARPHKSKPLTGVPRRALRPSTPCRLRPHAVQFRMCRAITPVASL